jgi:hypothetical protein
MNILLDNGHKINNLSIYIDFVDYVRVFLFFKFNNNLRAIFEVLSNKQTKIRADEDFN